MKHRRVVAVVAALLTALVAPACSDAHTQAEKDRADTGMDPRVITVIAPQGLEPMVEALGAAFQREHPEFRITYKIDNPEDLPDRVASVRTPVVWIDDAATARAYTEAPVGTVPLGDEGLVLVTNRKYRGPPVALADFGGGSGPRSGLCAPELRCGEAARQVLKERGVEPHPDKVYDSEQELIRAVVLNEVSTAMVFASYAAIWWASIVRDEFAPPDDQPRSIEARGYGNAERLDTLIDWLNSSPRVGRLVAQSALTPASRA